MQRVDTATAVAALPAQDAAVAPGYFSKGNPATGVPATIPGQDWFNAVQEELVSVVLATGVALDRTKNDQILTAINKLISMETSYIAAGGTANAMTLALPALTAHVTGRQITFKAASTNTATVTVNVNGLGAIALKDAGGNALVSGNIVAGCMYKMVYTGAEYRLLSPVSSPASLAANGYYKFPGGLIVQWGTLTNIAVGGSSAVVFPITFPSAVLYLSPTPTTLSNTLSHIAGFNSLTTSGFNAINTNGSAGPISVFWLALGY